MGRNQTRLPFRAVRSLFISDVHLGSRHCHPENLTILLNSVIADNIYILGDFIDGWLLKCRWRWKESYNDLIRALMGHARKGSRLVYLPGNHDQCLRKFFGDWGMMEIQDQMIHHCADGKRLLLIHGDRFDRFQTHCGGIARWSAQLHEAALSLGSTLNWAMGGTGHRKFGTGLTIPFKAAVQHLSQYRKSIQLEAIANDCEGIVCGHIHAPDLLEENNFVYANTGDWLEHCTFLVEHDDGKLELWTCGPQEAGRFLAVLSKEVAPLPHQKTPRKAPSPFVQTVDAEMSHGSEIAV